MDDNIVSDHSESWNKNPTNDSEVLDQSSEQQNIELKSGDSTEKHTAVWTSNSIEVLLKIYESKLEMLETPKKKTRIWIAVSDSLKEYDIEMSPDQVRWKINALAKKYKQCINCGNYKKFKYFNEMDHIYSRFNVDCDSDLIKRRTNKQSNDWAVHKKIVNESKAMIELRKLRLASRMETDKTQAKLHIERQWLDYLTRQEQNRCNKDDIFERTLKLREEELEIKKKELELKETLEYRNIELSERNLDEIINIETEKCELLKQLFV